MDKLVYEGENKVTISNDGATIMKLLDVIHPAAKTLVDIAKSQDSEVRSNIYTPFIFYIVSLPAHALYKVHHHTHHVSHIHIFLAINITPTIPLLPSLACPLAHINGRLAMVQQV